MNIFFIKLADSPSVSTHKILTRFDLLNGFSQNNLGLQYFQREKEFKKFTEKIQQIYNRARLRNLKLPFNDLYNSDLRVQRLRIILDKIRNRKRKETLSHFLKFSFLKIDSCIFFQKMGFKLKKTNFIAILVGLKFYFLCKKKLIKKFNIIKKALFKQNIEHLKHFFKQVQLLPPKNNNDFVYEFDIKTEIPQFPVVVKNKNTEYTDLFTERKKKNNIFIYDGTSDSRHNSFSKFENIDTFQDEGSKEDSVIKNSNFNTFFQGDKDGQMSPDPAMNSYNTFRRINDSSRYDHLYSDHNKEEFSEVEEVDQLSKEELSIQDIKEEHEESENEISESVKSDKGSFKGFGLNKYSLTKSNASDISDFSEVDTKPETLRNKQSNPERFNTERNGSPTLSEISGKSDQASFSIEKSSSISQQNKKKRFMFKKREPIKKDLIKRNKEKQNKVQVEPKQQNFNKSFTEKNLNKRNSLKNHNHQSTNSLRYNMSKGLRTSTSRVKLEAKRQLELIRENNNLNKNFNSEAIFQVKKKSNAHKHSLYASRKTNFSRGSNYIKPQSSLPRRNNKSRSRSRSRSRVKDYIENLKSEEMTQKSQTNNTINMNSVDRQTWEVKKSKVLKSDVSRINLQIELNFKNQMQKAISSMKIQTVKEMPNLKKKQKLLKSFVTLVELFENFLKILKKNGNKNEELNRLNQTISHISTPIKKVLNSKNISKELQNLDLNILHKILNFLELLLDKEYLQSNSSTQSNYSQVYDYGTFSSKSNSNIHEKKFSHQNVISDSKFSPDISKEVFQSEAYRKNLLYDSLNQQNFFKKSQRQSYQQNLKFGQEKRVMANNFCFLLNCKMNLNLKRKKKFFFELIKNKNRINNFLILIINKSKLKLLFAFKLFKINKLKMKLLQAKSNLNNSPLYF